MNVIRIRFQKSDVKRWSQNENLNDNWDERTKILALLIREGETVIDFGAGKMRLRNFIPASCRYTATDIVQREEGVIVADLNKLPLPAVGCHDVAVFSGVMEYLHNVPGLVEEIKSVAPRVIVSYAVLERKPEILRRRAWGFANDYTEAEFCKIFEKAGFNKISRSVWGEQILFEFEQPTS